MFCSKSCIHWRGAYVKSAIRPVAQAQPATLVERLGLPFGISITKTLVLSMTLQHPTEVPLLGKTNDQLSETYLELLHLHAHRALQFAFICFAQRVLDVSVHTCDHSNSILSYLVRVIEICCFCILLSIFNFVSSLHKLVIELVYLQAGIKTSSNSIHWPGPGCTVSLICATWPCTCSSVTKERRSEDCNELSSD